ncbi:amidase [Catenulispora sp. EB89]|uniref:amidase n=1 Tax=Catenulispora sp. EB89 TaxID=3156257 RepID=UPI003516635D
MDIHYDTLIETAEAIRTRQISPVELTHMMLDRIALVDPQLHSYATVTAELALAQAARAEKEILAGHYRGPLHGIPIAVKDIFDTGGIVTASGMPLHAERVPEADATVVARLADAGSVLLGKLQLTEGALAHHHPDITSPNNPWNTDYYAGASSSGSGVATAAGLCFGALGSDTGGSIRFPAAATGLTGLKPTWGRVSRHGMTPLAESLDHVGTLTRAAADAGALLGVIAGPDPLDPTALTAVVPDYLDGLGSGIAGVRIGIDTRYNETGCDPAVVDAVRDAARVLENLGATLREVSLPDYSGVVAHWGSICAVEAAIAHEATYPADAARYGRLAETLEAGRAVQAMDLMQWHYERLAFTGALATLFRDIDLLVIPTQPRADFTLADEAEEFSTAEGLAHFIRFATPFDMSGSPTITLPAGFTDKGLPLSFQLVARHLDEPLLIRAGDAYQRATDWTERHPM